MLFFSLTTKHLNLIPASHCYELNVCVHPTKKLSDVNMLSPIMMVLDGKVIRKKLTVTKKRPKRSPSPLTMRECSAIMNQEVGSHQTINLWVP